MSKQTKTKKTKPAPKKAAKAPTKSVAKQTAPAKAAKAKTGSGVGKAVGITIAVSAVVAAGLGVGGFFLGKTLAGGNGGGSATTFTVTLLPGEGNFAEDEPYLVFNNVKKGTTLSKLDGYAEPTTIDQKDFDFWVDSEGEQIVDTTTIESNLVLTASFIEGAEYHKIVTLKEIKDKLDDLTEAKADGYVKAYETVYNKLNEIFNDNAIDDDEQVVAIKKYADSTLDDVLSCTSSEAQGPADEFEKSLELALNEDKDLSLALLNTGAAYQKAKAVSKSNKLIDVCYPQLTDFLKSAKTESLPILKLIVPSIMENSANATSDDFAKYAIGKINDAVKFITAFTDLTEEQTEELVTLYSNYIVAYSKTETEEAKTAVDTFLASCKDNFQAALEESSEKEIAKYKLKFEGMVSLANISSSTQKPQYDFEGVIGCIDNIVDTFEKCYPDMSEDQVAPARELALYGCKAVKNVNGKVSNLDFSNIYNQLFGGFLNKDNEPYKELYLTAIKSLAEIPDVGIQEMMEKVGLSLALTPMLELIEKTKEEFKKVESSLAKELIIIIQSAKIESFAYSQLWNKVDSKDWWSGLKATFDELYNVILKQPDEPLRLKALACGGALVGYSKLTQFLLAVGNPSECKTYLESTMINNVLTSLNSVVGELEEEQFAPIGNLLNGIFSSYPIRYRSPIATGNKSEAKKYIEKFEQTLIEKLSSYASEFTKLNNFLKHYYKLYVDNDYLFFYEDKGSPTATKFSSEWGRLKQLLEAGDSSILFNPDYSFAKAPFDEIYSTMQEGFYSKLCPDINMSLTLKFLGRVKSLIE